MCIAGTNKQRIYVTPQSLKKGYAASFLWSVKLSDLNSMTKCQIGKGHELPKPPNHHPKCLIQIIKAI